MFSTVVALLVSGVVAQSTTAEPPAVQTQVEEVEYHVRSRPGDASSLVNSLHESTGLPVVLYYDRHFTLKNLNITYKSEDELVRELKKAGIEVNVLPEGIALAPIAYEHEAYNHSLWNSPVRAFGVRRLGEASRPKEDGFTFENPTDCVILDFSQMEGVEVKVHELFHMMQLLVVGSDLEWESFGKVVAAAVGAEFEHFRADYTLSPDPTAIIRRVSLFQDRFPQPLSNDPVVNVDYYQHAITAHLFKTHFSPEELEALLIAKPFEMQLAVPVKARTKLHQLTIGAFTGMQQYITDAFPRGVADINELEVFVSPYKWSSIKAVNREGGGYVF